MNDPTLLVELAPDLWSAESRVRFVRQWVPTRMVVIRLRDGSLLVHSPIEARPELCCRVDALGPVRHLVAPSCYHHLWFAGWVQAHPSARTYGARGLAEKRRDLRIDHVLGSEPPAAWAGELDQLVYRALPMFNEVVFLHRASRTLLVTDLVFNIQRAEGLLAPLVMRLNGMWKRFGPSRALRLATRFRRREAAEDLRAILAWEFERVVMAHGSVLERGGRDALRRAFAFLLQ